MNKNHYAVKENEYFSNVRMDIISLLPLNQDQKILEIGAGGGNTLVYIKENNIASEVMGIELMKIENSNQNNPLIDKFQIANIEQDDIDAEEENFDIIICADVLEHLNDPWAAIDKIQKYLKTNGLLIASIPNIREWKTLSAIVFKGEFNYQQEGGIMDRTHLRFFCKKNMYRMLHTSVLTPILCKPNFMMKIVPEGKKRRVINMMSFRLFEDFLAVQYLFIAKKN